MTVLQASDALKVLDAHSLPMQGLNRERDNFYKFKVDGLGLCADPNFKHLYNDKPADFWKSLLRLNNLTTKVPTFNLRTFNCYTGWCFF